MLRCIEASSFNVFILPRSIFLCLDDGDNPPFIVVSAASPIALIRSDFADLITYFLSLLEHVCRKHNFALFRFTLFVISSSFQHRSSILYKIVCEMNSMQQIMKCATSIYTFPHASTLMVRCKYIVYLLIYLFDNVLFHLCLVANR